MAPLSFSDGRSLKPLLTGPAPSAWRQAFFLEEFGTGEFDPPDVLAGTPREPLDKADLATVVPIPSYYGFQAPGYKYVEYKSGEKELYVASDPYELTNVASKVESIDRRLSRFVPECVRRLRGRRLPSRGGRVTAGPRDGRSSP